MKSSSVILCFGFSHKFPVVAHEGSLTPGDSKRVKSFCWIVLECDTAGFLQFSACEVGDGAADFKYLAVGAGS